MSRLIEFDMLQNKTLVCVIKKFNGKFFNICNENNNTQIMWDYNPQYAHYS